MGPTQIEFSKPRALQRIPAHSDGARVRVAGAEVVTAGGLGIRRTGIAEETNAELKILPGANGPEKIEPMPLIVIRPRPLSVWAYAGVRKRPEINSAASGSGPGYR